MEKALETEILKEKYASLSPERREEIKMLAYELMQDKEFIKSAELLINNSSTLKVDEAKFKNRLGMIAALSVAITSALML